MGDTLVNLKADTVEDFMEKVSKEVGLGEGVMGETTYNISSKYDTDENDNIDKVTFKLTVSIKRAHWAGGKADANNKKAIEAAEDLNKKHEQKHKKKAEEICATEFKKAEKDLKGKTPADVELAVVEMRRSIDEAYEELDAKEGVTKVTENANGTFTVKQVGR